ncbi:MAG TPA: translation initiation factor IF-2, partial [Anaerolineae bacterium]
MATTKTPKENERAARSQAAPASNQPARPGPGDKDAPRQGNAPQGPSQPNSANPNRTGAPAAGAPRSQDSRPGNQVRRPDEAQRPSSGQAPRPGQGPNQGRRPEGTRPEGNRPAGGSPNQAPGRRPEGGRPGMPAGQAPGRRNEGEASGGGQPGSMPPSSRPGGGPGGPSRTPNGNASHSNNGPRFGQHGNSSRGPASRGGGGHGNHDPNRRPGGGPQGKGRSAQASSSQSREAAEARPATPPAPAVNAITEIVIPPQITVRELAEAMHKSPIEVIKALMNYGIMVPITQTIDFDTAVIVGEDLGITVKGETAPEPEVEVAAPEAPRTLRQQIMADEDPNALVIRPPVVTVLGHVDHGKTTLLDAIRSTRVVEGEAGGITQHIGAYQVTINDRKITFLDTPGHAAFTAMRARGASVTDIAVLVVAADDGVMPQTKEAIAHARAAQVPIVVALNKIDKPGANADRVKQELAENDVLVEEYGGDVVCVPVSAKMRRGIDDLLESILLVYDVEPAKANPNGATVGSVIESRLDERRGPTATLLVQNGTLRQGDSIVLGDTYGKVRAMFDDKGQAINEAPPATPAVILGLSEVPVAGDTFKVVADEKTARAIAGERVSERRAQANQPAPKAMTLENIFAQVEAGQAKDLNLILKADVQGSIEPIVNSLEKLSNDKVRVKILHQGTGNITESDVMLAVASKAIILGFSVTLDSTAQREAEAEGVDIRLYNIIYNLVEDVEKALAGMLEPVYQEVVIGHAEIRQVFRVSKVGKIAGCMVVDGELVRGASVRVRRGGQVIHEDKL